MVKLIGLDTETVAVNSVHEFYSFQAYSDDYPHLRVFSTNPDDITKLLTDKYKNAWFVTFNLSFDAIVISKMLKNKGYTFMACFAGSRITRCTIRKGGRKWVICDLRNIFPNTNLAKIGEALKLNKLEKPSYLGQRAPQTPQEIAYFYQYAMRDAEICYRMSALIRDEFKTFRSTCAGLAIRIFKRDFCHIRKLPKYNDVLNDKFRLAYHGGRTECFIRGVNTEKVKVYDVNSLYPYVMKVKPYPNVLENFTHKSSLNLEHEGIAHVQISQDAAFPPIGIKHLCIDGLTKLLFPNGTFNAWCTYPELRALEQHGCGKILKVYEAYEWANTCKPFTEYIDYMYAKKQEASINDSPKRMLYKIMLNSTYGKFGEHGLITFRVFEGDEIVLEVHPQPKAAWYHSVVWAAYITAYARLHTWGMIRSLNPNGVYYTDTDCAHTSEDLSSQCSDALGALKVEKECPAMQACYIRSKFYMIDDAVVMKGFKVYDTAAKVKLAIFQGNFTRYEHRITKALEAQRIHKPALFEYDMAKRFSVEEDGKRNFKRYLDNQALLFENSLSIPVQVMEQ